MVTTAPGITAPVGSVTVPAREDVCPNRHVESARQNASIPTSFFICNLSPLVLNEPCIHPGQAALFRTVTIGLVYIDSVTGSAKHISILCTTRSRWHSTPGNRAAPRFHDALQIVRCENQLAPAHAGTDRDDVPQIGGLIEVTPVNLFGARSEEHTSE